jgi:hypothetical protein
MSESVTQVPAAQGTQGPAVGGDVVNPASLSQTPAQAAAAVPGSLVTDAGKAATAPGSLVTDAADPSKTAADPAKVADPAADPAKTVVPEKYEIKFGDKEADPAQLEAFTPIAKELGLTNEQAQKLATFHNDQVQALLGQQTQVQTDAWANLQKAWQTEARADKEYGHLAGGKTFDENVSLIAKGLSTFGTPELNKALIDSGMGNHPEIARFMFRVGKAVSEDSIRVGSAGSSGAPKASLASRMFPTMAQ